ncbi:MAG: GGDEF domain-containing protein [Epsilonproteobacteria bacterium]|nr:MAG: GGDEF domain-containing protein [Campylobacterota bacterium]
MKQSIKNIFGKLSLFFLFATLFAGLGALMTIDHSRSYDKLDNLANQKYIISSLTKLSKDDIELALIQFNGKSTQLLHDIDKLRNSYEYNFTEKYVLDNSKEYLSDLDKLKNLTITFNQNARDYYTKDKKNEKVKETVLKESFHNIFNQINNMIFRSVNYNKAKFNIHKNVTYFAFIVILVASLIFRKKLNAIYGDLYYLYNMSNKDYVIYSEEADAISLRMNRKPTTSDNPSMLDPVTGINNHKGMVNSYAEKKGMKESNFTSLTIIEIDNFSKAHRAYSQEFTQNILKKVAFTISLHEQATDVISRIDYNQFAIILSRSSKEASFKDIDIIRQSISEIKFKSPQTGSITVTVSGGYVIKPNNTTLDESLRESRKILEHAKSHGKNRVSQAKDLQESAYAEA